MPFFQISLKKSELKTTHNTFRDCRVHFFPTTFLKMAVNGMVVRQVPLYIILATE